MNFKGVALFYSISLFSITGLFAQGPLNAYQYSISKKFSCEFCNGGSVVSAHPLASKVGVQILQQGGNAVDAAIATQLALAVVYPGAGNIGGGGFLVGYLNNARLPNGQGKSLAIDYREKAPGKASRDMYLDGSKNVIPGLSEDGHLAAGVPGTIAGLFKSHKYAKLPFAKLIQPAIDLAEKGFAITAGEASSLNAHKDEFIKLNMAPTAFVKNTQWEEGDTLIQKDLAQTLKRIRDRGKDGFYMGETARLIVQEMHKAGGLISYDDLEKYEAKERNPIVFNYRGHKIITMPLPSSGGVLLQQMLKIMEQKRLDTMKFHSPEATQLMVEAERRSYADRAEFLGDPDFVKVPVKTLTSDAYITMRMNDYTPGVAGSSTVTKAGIIKESEETTHLSVLDKDGNAVSVTTTLNGGYGSRTVVSGAGFLLNNEMDDFSVKPGVPNMYGAVGNEKNAIAPYKRMLSSMTPTIVLKDNKPYMVVGTPGGTTIPTSVFQTIVNIIDFKLSPEDAVNKPKFHHQWLPDLVFVEKGFEETTVEALKKMGYKISERGAIGRTEVILTDMVRAVETQEAKPPGYKHKMKRVIIAVGDNRGDDSAEGY